jgi:hypothetical protein
LNDVTDLVASAYQHSGHQTVDLWTMTVDHRRHGSFVTLLARMRDGEMVEFFHSGCPEAPLLPNRFMLRIHNWLHERGRRRFPEKNKLMDRAVALALRAALLGANFCRRTSDDGHGRPTSGPAR